MGASFSYAETHGKYICLTPGIELDFLLLSAISFYCSPISLCRILAWDATCHSSRQETSMYVGPTLPIVEIYIREAHFA